ncbi:MAG: glycosyltransferase [Proteobacteria bacterium]|nr:MAG: glycosyltransferase [Pseudomonadota bacterium]
MKPSLTYRVLAKLQTFFVQKLMRVSFGSNYSTEDVHLKDYTPLQVSSESLLDADDPLPSLDPTQKVLIVIPFRDKWSMTELCFSGLLKQGKDQLELLVALVDNGSTEKETREGIERAISRGKEAGIKVRHLRYEVPFNFSFLNNQAVRDCEDFNADIVGLINNDIEFLDTDSLQQLVRGSLLPQAGAVGCTLLYPEGKVQHLFVFVGSKIVGSHPYKGFEPDLNAKWYEHPRAVGAVTGAVMFIQRERFESVGGFDELLPTSYQDVDLCLKFQKKQWINWVLPKVILIHHETQTRSLEPSWNEAQLVEKKWGEFLLRNPFVSLAWSRKSEHFVFTPRAFLRFIFSQNA